MMQAARRTLRPQAVATNDCEDAENECIISHSPTLSNLKNTLISVSRAFGNILFSELLSQKRLPLSCGETMPRACMQKLLYLGMRRKRLLMRQNRKAEEEFWQRRAIDGRHGLRSRRKTFSFLMLQSSRASGIARRSFEIGMLNDFLIQRKKMGIF